MTHRHIVFSICRQVALALLLRAILVVMMTACCVVSPAQGQQKEAQLEYFQSFKGAPEKSHALEFIGPNANERVKLEATGLRITLPRNHPKESPTGLATGIAARGDFEVTLRYEVLAEPAPDDAGPLGTRLSLMAGWQGPGENTVKLTRAMRQGSKFIAFWNAAAGNEKNKTKMAPAREKTGKLRLARKGEMISFFVADGADHEFTLLHTVRFSAEDLGNVSIVATTGGPKAALDVRFTDLHIRASSAPSAAGAAKKTTGVNASEEKASAAVRKWGGSVTGRPVTEVRLANSKVTDADLEQLLTFTQLQKLWIDYTPVTDAGLRHLPNFKQLDELGADGTRMTDVGLQHLAALPKLEVLHLEQTGVTDGGLKTVGALKGLRRLYLSTNRITDAGLKELTGLQQLTVLWLSRTQMTDEGLKDVARLLQLTELGLSSTKVSDAGLKYLEPLIQLRSLNLWDVRAVTDAGLKNLAGLRQLRKLDVRRTQVSEAGSDELAKALQKTQILVNEPARTADGLLPEPPTLAKETKDFYHDFRNSPFPTKDLRVTPPNVTQLIKPEPEGLRISLSAEDDTSGVATQFHVLGDFEITVGYEILKVEQMTGWMGGGLEIYLMTETPTKEALGFDRRIRSGGQAVYTFSRMSTNNQGKREVDVSDPRPAKGQAGQMRITRIGSKAVMSIAEGDSKTFQVLYRAYLGNEEVKFLRLAANPGGSAHVVDLRLHNLRVRAEGLGLDFDISPPPKGSALWIVAGLVIALAVLGGALIWWKRKRRPKSARETE